VAIFLKQRLYQLVVECLRVNAQSLGRESGKPQCDLGGVPG